LYGDINNKEVEAVMMDVATCEICGDNMKTCYEEIDTEVVIATECMPGFYLYKGTCVNPCPDGYTEGE
jgi:hypothetical protein